MPRYRVIRESSRRNTRDPFAETGWWVLGPGGGLSYASMLATDDAEHQAWLAAARQTSADDEIFDYLDSYGGDMYFRALSLPEWRDATDLDALIDDLKRAQNEGAR